MLMGSVHVVSDCRYLLKLTNPNTTRTIIVLKYILTYLLIR